MKKTRNIAEEIKAMVVDEVLRGRMETRLITNPCHLRLGFQKFISFRRGSADELSILPD